MTTRHEKHWDWQHTNVSTWQRRDDLFTVLVYEADSGEWEAYCWLHGDDSGAAQIGHTYPSRLMAMEACARHTSNHGVRHTFQILNFAA